MSKDIFSLIGKEIKRTELHREYGGQQQGGISTPANHPYIFIFATESGQDYGYEDGWDNERSYFTYTGQGTEGDMSFISGNKALRDHQQEGKHVLLFTSVGNGTVRCEGELNLIDYMWGQTPDKNKNNRESIHFRLKRISHLHKDSSFSNEPENIEPNETERRGLVNCRVGQGPYRRKLLSKFYEKCAVTGCDIESILIASHIVPWSESSDRERLDVNNGILLSPTYDALFDKHLISFADDGKIIISDRIRDELKTLSVDESARIQVNDEMKFYLERHRSKLR